MYIYWSSKNCLELNCQKEKLDFPCSSWALESNWFSYCISGGEQPGNLSVLKSLLPKSSSRHCGALARQLASCKNVQEYEKFLQILSIWLQRICISCDAASYVCHAWAESSAHFADKLNLLGQEQERNKTYSSKSRHLYFSWSPPLLRLKGFRQTWIALARPHNKFARNTTV